MGGVLSLIESFLKQGVLDGLQEWTPEEGSPQGGCISPLLSNIYLNPLDHLMAEQGFEMVRYADDFVILCRSPEEAARALAVVQQWTAEAGLKLHPDKTKIVDATVASFDFLGYRFARGGATRDPRACRSSRTPSERKRSGHLGKACRRSSLTSPPRCEAGLSTSSTATRPRSSDWTGGFGCGCEASSENAWA